MKPHPVGGAIFQFAIGISVEGYIRCADLILQRCKTQEANHRIMHFQKAKC